MAGVQVENLSFSYTRRGRNLENINMLVPRGTIYGLLGPSGCCKTTLLRCIVGRLKPRQGSVLVFGYKPGTKECGIPGPNIGYMPQDLSLISQFTVRETLEYYAGFAQTPDPKGVYHRDRQQRVQDLNARIEFLLKLLDISDFEHIFTDRLSGGQKRRVSLAVAMINDPPLLILDEPTVGVDPIVRDSIWNYLVEQSKNGLTIIVTTHYIEEAASAHKVGFMRQGRILAEGNPGQLMRQFQVPTLESLFLKLSRHDDVTRTTPENELLCSIAMESITNSNSNSNKSHHSNHSNSNHPNSHQNGHSRSHSNVSFQQINNSYNHRNHAHGGSFILNSNHHSRSNTINSMETGFNQQLDHQLSNGFVNKSQTHLYQEQPLTLPPIDYHDVDYSNNNNNNNIDSNIIENGEHQNQVISNSNSPDVVVVPTTNTETQVQSQASTNLLIANGTSAKLANPNKSSSTLDRQLNGGTKLDTLSNKKSRAYSIHSTSHRVNSFQKVGVLCKKHRLRLFRRVPELVITMLLPALEVALFCLCMGRDPTAIQMAVCNQEKPPFMSLVFLKSIDPDFIQLKYYNTPEEAINSVRNADTYSAIVLAKNFTASMHQFASKIFPDQLANSGQNHAAQDSATTLARILQNSILNPVPSSSPMPPMLTHSSSFGGPRSLETPSLLMESSTPLSSTVSGGSRVTSTTSTTTLSPITNLPTISDISASSDSNTNELASTSPNGLDESIIKIYYDGSNALHVNIIRRELFSAIFRFVDQLGKAVGNSGIVNMLPIKFEKPIYGNEKTDMIEFVGPGLMVFIVFFATMSITSMAFLSERREGTLERSLIVGMTPTEFIISQIINITFLLVVQITLTVVMGFWIFSFPMKGSYILAVAMMFCQGLCGMTYGLMLSAICTNEMTALMLGAGSQLMFCFITGIFWPVDTMIPLLRYFSYMMPQTLPMESFRHILIRGFDLSRAAVWNGYLISMGWVVFFLLLAILIFRLR